MDKDVERVLLSQLEIQKQKLKNEINELEKQLNDNNMSEQNNPYVEKINEARVEYKTFSSDTLAGLDFDVSDALNEGYQPAGPQYKADGWFYQPMVRVPRQLVAQPIRG